MAESSLNSPQKPYLTLPVWGWGLVFLIGLEVGFASQSLPSALAIIFGVIALLTAALMLLRPWYITYLLVLTFPFLSTLPRGLLPVPFKIDELLIVFGILVFVISPAKSKRLILTKIDLVFVVLVISGAILPVIGMLFRNTEPNWLDVIALAKPYFLYRLVVMTIDDRPKLNRTLVLLLLPPLLVSVIALLQLLNVGNMQTYLAKIYYDTPAVQVLTRNLTGINLFLRATSTLGNWNALGSYSAMVAILCFSLMRATSKPQFKSLPAISFALAIGGLLLAGSSSSWVGFIVGGFVVVLGGLKRFRLRKNHLIGATLIILVLVVGIQIVGGDIVEAQINRQSASYIYDRASEQYYPTHGFPASVVARWYLAKHLFRLIWNDQIALFAGFGENEYSISLLPWGTAESGYVGMLFFYGPFYLISYFLLMFTALMYGLRLGKRFITQDKTLYSLTLALNGMIIAMVVMNLISSYYSAAGTSHFFIITMALVMSCHRKQFQNVTEQGTGMNVFLGEAA